MAKRKKDETNGEEKSAHNSEIDLPKRIKTYLSNSASDPAYRVKESERIVDEILKSPVVVAKVRAILKRKAKISPAVVERAKAILKQRSKNVIEFSSDSDSSSDSTESDILSLAPSDGFSSEDSSQFRLLEKNIKKMEVDMENGTVQSIRIEVFKLNGNLFDGILSESDLLEIWKCIGGSEGNIKQHASEQDSGRCLKITYIVNTPIKLISISPHEEFNFKKKGKIRTDVFRARLLDFGLLEYNLGDLVPVTFQKTFFKVTVEEMAEWLKPYGVVEGEFSYTKSKDTGIGTDNYIVQARLNKHIPEILPIAGRRLFVTYPGQVKQCKRCFEQGHVSTSCNLKIDWLDYVIKLMASGDFRIELFEGWKTALTTYKSDILQSVAAANTQNTQDLRQILNFNRPNQQPPVQQQNPTTQQGQGPNQTPWSGINPWQTNQEPRQSWNQGQNQAWQQPQPWQTNNNWQQGQSSQYFNRGRGRGRGRGRTSQRNFGPNY